MPVVFSKLRDPVGEDPARAARRSSRASIAAGLTLVLGLGIAFRVTFPRLPPMVPPDSGAYLSAAAALRDTGFDWSSRRLTPFRTPAYPVVLALLGEKTGEERRIVVFQQALGVAVMGLVFWLAYSFSRSVIVGCLCGLICGMSGQQVYYEFSVLSDVLSEATLLAALALFALAVERGTPARWLGVGLAIGVSALVRPSNLALLPVSIVYSIFPRRRLAEPACLFLGAALLLVPWIDRNRRVFGTATLSSLQGYALMLRTDSLVDFQSPREAEVKRALLRELKTKRDPPAEPVHMVRMELAHGADAEIALDKKMRAIAWEAIRTHPARYLAGTAYEGLALLKSYGQPVGSGPPLVPRGTRALHDLGLWIEISWGNLIYALAFAALLLSVVLPLPRAYRAFAVSVLLFLCAQAPVVTGIERYRLTVQPALWLVLLTAPVVIWRTRPSSRRFAAGCAVTAILLVCLGLGSLWEAAQRRSDLGPSRNQTDAVHPFVTWPWIEPYEIYIRNHPPQTPSETR